MQAAGTAVYVAGYDLTGAGLYRNTMDGGERRTLNNVAGNLIRSWDSRGHVFRIRYDRLQRPTHRYVSSGGDPEILVERSVYGEGQPERNLCVRLSRQYDSAGVATVADCRRPLRRDDNLRRSQSCDSNRHATQRRDEIECRPSLLRRGQPPPRG